MQTDILEKYNVPVPRYTSQIEQLMCNYRTRLSNEQMAQHRDKLEETARDGIVDIDGNTIVITQKGLPFVRNVAAALDPLMEHTTKAFSKPI